jgi:hypothetical protein
MIDMMPHLDRTEDLLVFHEEKKRTIHPIEIRSHIRRDDIEELFVSFSDEKPPRTRRSGLKISPFCEHGETRGFVGDGGESEMEHYNLNKRFLHLS